MYDTVNVYENYNPNDGIPEEDLQVRKDVFERYPNKLTFILSDDLVKKWLVCASKTYHKLQEEIRLKERFAKHLAMRCIKYTWINYLDFRIETSVEAFDGCYGACYKGYPAPKDNDND
nr:unnamed protein product [Callosobruchus chinensis]